MQTINAEAADNPFSFTAQEICGDDHAVWWCRLMKTDRGETEGVGIYKVSAGKLT